MLIDRKRFKDQVLFVDIETSLLHIYAHCIGSKQNINHFQVEKDKKIICISYMAEGWKKPKSLIWDSKQDDKKLLNEFVKLANQYPILVGQNGDSFDFKVIRGRCWAQTSNPMPDIVTLDTLKMSRQNMRLTSHKLDWKSHIIGRGGKLDTGFQLWIDVEKGNKKALNHMVKYCEQDVLELQAVFWSMLPYCNKLPHHLGALLLGHQDSCPGCASTNRIKNKIRKTKTGDRQQWMCKDCGRYWTDTRRIR